MLQAPVGSRGTGRDHRGHQHLPQTAEQKLDLTTDLLGTGPEEAAAGSGERAGGGVEGAVGRHETAEGGQTGLRILESSTHAAVLRANGGASG